MNILVTGGAGFIGTNFIRCALNSRSNWHITNLDALTYAGNPLNLKDLEADLAERYRLVHGDIRDASLLKPLFSEYAFNGWFTLQPNLTWIVPFISLGYSWKRMS